MTEPNQDPKPGPNPEDKKAASETAGMNPQELLAYESARSARIVAEARLAELQRTPDCRLTRTQRLSN
jgi:hypothetical protein